MLLGVNKIKKINTILLYLFAISLIIAIFQTTTSEQKLSGIVLFISMVLLLYINNKASKNRNIQIKLLYIFLFIIIITVTIYVNGSCNSILFPFLFVLPFLYAVVNFSQRESTGLIILILAVLWLFLFQDTQLNKLYQVELVSAFIILIQVIINFLLAKDYTLDKKRIVHVCNECTKKDRDKIENV